MKKSVRLPVLIAVVAILGATLYTQLPANADEPAKTIPEEKVESPRTPIQKLEKSTAEWKSQLSPQAFRVLRQKGTERPWTGTYNKWKKQGVFVCAGCELPLFDSRAKFDSGTGWPSFYQPLHEAHVLEVTDRSHGMVRTEVVCARCEGHLGHVFKDGPDPTGLRYCINSVSLDFRKVK